MYELLYEICNIPTGTGSSVSQYVAYLTVALVAIFVALLVDFLARILGRFLPRWNRNL